MRTPHLLATLAFVVALTGGSIASAQFTHRNQPRLRVGLEGGLGPQVFHGSGGSGAVLGQLGVQVNDRFGVFYQPSLMLNAIGRDPSTALVRSTDHLLMGDVTFGPLQFGVGGGVAAALRAPCQVSTSCVSGPAEMRPAVGARVAGVITFPGSRARIGIPIAANLHVADPISGDRVTTLVLTIGVQRF